MKMRVKRNLRDLPDPDHHSVVESMVRLEGKVIEFHRTGNTYYDEEDSCICSWDANWLDPVNKNEAWFQSLK
jgi:hypothetical protein